MTKGKLIVLSGPSGVGKGTIINKVLESDRNLMLSISATTRDEREGEINGINYHFITLDEFKDKLDKGDLLEYAKVYGNYYGTPKKLTIDLLEKGNDVILEIDTVGAMNIKQMFKDAITIFLMPPDKETLISRLSGRGTETEEVMQKRIESASHEIEKADMYDYVILNDDADKCANDVIEIIRKEKKET